MQSSNINIEGFLVVKQKWSKVLLMEQTSMAGFDEHQPKIQISFGGIVQAQNCTCKYVSRIVQLEW